MSGLPLRQHPAAFLALRQTQPALFWQRSLFWTFCFHMAFFASGYGFREVVPVICLICLGMYYRHAWKESVLRSLPVLPLFISLWIMMAIGVLFSLNPWQSFLATATTFNKGLILPFLAMESVRSCRDLKRLAAASLVAFFWVGLSGICQAITGYDFPLGYTMHAGRLTAAIGDYCVGNYLMQVLIPALGVWYLLRERFSVPKSLLVLVLLLVPGLFTLWGAGARSGLVALVGAALAWWVLVLRCRWWKIIVPCALAALLLLAAVGHEYSQRMSMQSFQNDGRWDLWRLAREIIATWPVFGAGAGMFNTAFRSLGLIPVRDLITIEHPHNLYLDILCSTGIVGAIFGFLFLFGMLWWLGRKLLPRLHATWNELHTQAAAERADADAIGSPLYWRLAALFALGYLAWLVNGITGHEFYRMWWLGQAMQGLGVAIGAIVLAEKTTCERPAEAPAASQKDAPADDQDTAGHQ